MAEESEKQLLKKSLRQFDFSAEIITQMRDQSSIPIDFYNKDGQILIHKKGDASNDDIERLMRFQTQGIFIRESDLAKLSGRKEGVNSVHGRDVSFTKLIDPELTLSLANETKNILADLKNSPFHGSQFKSVSKSIDNILGDFSSSNDVETGLVNVIEVMKRAGLPADSEVITKRTVICMALKLRGMKAISRAEAEIQKREQLDIMLSSYLCDLGYTQMKLPQHANLSQEEFNYIKNHPLISYLMVGNMEDVESKIKYNVLNHHRPFKGEGVSNNYPSIGVIAERLKALHEKYSQYKEKAVLADDITRQLKNFSLTNIMEEDAGIISISGEFASLTTDQSWRGAFPSSTALKLILNRSFFTYNEKTVKDFFDYLSLSLNTNVSVINPGDYVITVTSDSEKKIHFEICVVLQINRSLTRPLLERIGTIRPMFNSKGKYELTGFDLTTLKFDKRRAVINLELADPRRIVFIVDEDLNPMLFEEVDTYYRRVTNKLKNPEGGTLGDTTEENAVQHW